MKTLRVDCSGGGYVFVPETAWDAFAAGRPYVGPARYANQEHKSEMIVSAAGASVVRLEVPWLECWGSDWVTNLGLPLQP